MLFLVRVRVREKVSKRGLQHVASPGLQLMPASIAEDHLKPIFQAFADSSPLPLHHHLKSEHDHEHRR